jgi:predicted PurR-regulated permease PerM
MTEPTLGERPVPWRTIWAVIAAAGGTYLAYKLVIELKHVLILLVVALFFTVVLTPVVDFGVNRLKVRRGITTAIVILVGATALATMLYAFIRPLADQATNLADDLPTYVEDARHGKGPVGDLVERYDIEDWVDRNQDRLRDGLSGLGTPAISLARSVFSGIFAGVTVLVLTILMLMQGPHISASALALVPEDRREQVRRVAADSAKAVSGYVFGNLLISVIAGTAAWIVLTILGVPYAAVLGLFVGFADLIPLIGATLGAAPTVAFAFLHSVTAGITTLIFFIVYQQFENHVLQVTIMSRTVKVNPLTVLISVLVGVELLGFLGALLAIPAAGVLQVVIRDVYDERTGRLKPSYTVGADERPGPDGDGGPSAGDR